VVVVLAKTIVSAVTQAAVIAMIAVAAVAAKVI
jgi:hypothetical protein